MLNVNINVCKCINVHCVVGGQQFGADVQMSRSERIMFN